MIVQTTPEIAEGFFEHLQIMDIRSFDIKVSKHKLIDEKTKVYFIIENLSENIQDKISNLLDLYNQLVPDQKSNIGSLEDLKNTQDYWTPVKNFNITTNNNLAIPDITENQDNKITKLKSGIGFGIGLHPSTILVLRALGKKLTKNTKTLVDIGSGSGILSMYALSKGIENILAFEIQDEAIVTMKENFYRNNLDISKVQFNPPLSSPLLLGEGQGEVLFVANMRPQELNMVKDILLLGKHLIISGLMEKEISPISIQSSKELKFGEWRCVIIDQ